MSNHDALSLILDNLNAFYELERVRKSAPDGVLAFGPKDIKGREYAGVVLWHRPKGYAQYKLLTVFGVWAQVPDQIIAGTRLLTYTAAHYNPESYFHHLPRGFHVYYGASAPPPDASGQRLAFRYQPAQRLQQRQAIAALCQAYWRSSAGVD